MEMDLAVASDERHARFIERAVAGGQVWVLADPAKPGSWATSHVTFEDEKGEPEDVPVVPVWSDRAYAQRCAKGPWSVYVPEPIPLEDFVECVLQDMHHRDVMVGTNWSGQLIGRDCEAYDLAVELSEAVERGGG